MKCKTLRKPMAEEVKRLAVRTLEYRYHLDEKKAVIILLRVSFNENVSDGNELTTVRSSDVIQLALTLKVITAQVVETSVTVNNSPKKK